jgi:hypothetical protein
LQLESLACQVGIGFVPDGMSRRESAATPP